MKEIKSMQELYQRVLPALKTRRRELRRTGYFYIEERDIWEALQQMKWKDMSNLQLCDIIDDILNCDTSILEEFMKDNMQRMPKKIDESIL